MICKKLNTLSQYVDILKKSVNIHALSNVNSYNDFLKMSLKEEMFLGVHIIFKGFNEVYKGRYRYDGINGINGKCSNVTIDFNYPVVDVYVDHVCDGSILTLYDLAEATKGVLELKNINI